MDETLRVTLTTRLAAIKRYDDCRDGDSIASAIRTGEGIE
jgi:hypothetical protein